MTPSEMKPMPDYTEYHPRWYRSRVSTYWWLWRWPYLKFVLRELSSIFVAFFVVLTLLHLRSLIRGPEAYAEFQQWLKSPLLLALNTLSFFFVLLHAVTWFNLAPRAMAVRLAGQRVPDWAIAAANYIGWAVVSGCVVWFLLRS